MFEEIRKIKIPKLVTKFPLGVILWRIWMTFVLILGWVMTRVILSILFFIILTPLGLIKRLFGTDRHREKMEIYMESYWRYRPLGSEHRESYERQF